MVYGLLRALPGDRALLPPSLRGLAASLARRGWVSIRNVVPVAERRSPKSPNTALEIAPSTHRHQFQKIIFYGIEHRLNTYPAWSGKSLKLLTRHGRACPACPGHPRLRA